MKTKSFGLSIAIALLVSLFSFSSASAMVSYPPDEILPWPGSEANHASYWEAYFGSGWQCTKVDEGGDFTTTRDWDAIVIKNDQRNVIWKPAPAGHYTTDKGVSHWFKCTGPKPPPPPKPPKPELNYELSCVQWRDGGPRNAINWESSWDSHGRDLTYTQKVKIYNDPRSLKDWDVRSINYTTEADKGTYSKTKFVGRGTFRVVGTITFGYKTKHIDTYVDCAPLVLPLKAGFGATKGDPWERAWASNKMNITSQKVLWIFKGRDGWAKKKVTIPGGCRWNWGWNWVEGNSTMTLKWIKPNGDRVVIARKTVPPPGYYGKIPPTYRGYICS